MPKQMSVPVPNQTPSLAVTIKTARKSKAWSQTELSRQSHVSTRTIVDVERGEQKSPRQEVLIRLAQALDADPAAWLRLSASVIIQNFTPFRAVYDRVLQNTRDRGEHVTTLQGFAAGQPISVRRSDVHPAIVRARAEAVLANPQPYHPVLNNCEHTAWKVIQGIARSPQLAFFAVMAVVVLLVLMFSRR